MNILNEPIDSLHQQCIDLRERINAMFNEAKERAAQWEPSLRQSLPKR